MTCDEFNRVCVEKLKQMRFGERVAVVGSGLSYNLVTNINELVAAMKAPCRADKINSETSCQFFDRAFNNSPDEYFRVIKESFEKRPPWEARAYRHLVNIPFKSYPDRLNLTLEMLLAILAKPNVQLRWQISMERIGKLLSLGLNSNDPPTKQLAIECRDAILKMGVFEFLCLDDGLPA